MFKKRVSLSAPSSPETSSYIDARNCSVFHLQDRTFLQNTLKNHHSLTFVESSSKLGIILEVVQNAVEEGVVAGTLGRL
jgi:hypothetical protein